MISLVVESLTQVVLEFLVAIHNYYKTFNAKHSLMPTKDGNVWRTQRQIARPHFQVTEYKDAVLFNKHINKVCEILDKHVEATPNKPLNIQVSLLLALYISQSNNLYGLGT